MVEFHLCTSHLWSPPFSRKIRSPQWLPQIHCATRNRFGNAGWALVGFTCAGAGLATIIPNAFAAAGSVREASDDRGFNGGGWPDFTWQNGDISALPGRSCFPTDTFDHRCIRRRCPESLPLPRHRSHKYVNDLVLELRGRSFSLRAVRSASIHLLRGRCAPRRVYQSTSLPVVPKCMRANAAGRRD
jgi:hypothetical protein